VRALGAEPAVEGDRIGAQLASQSLDAIIDIIGGGWDIFNSLEMAFRSPAAT
jgi:hypothetical protein